MVSGRPRLVMVRLHERIDERVEKTLPNYAYINLALVENEEIILTKSYDRNRLEKTVVYASVSKPVTATILIRLLFEGAISSLDDDIAGYHAGSNGRPRAFLAVKPNQGDAVTLTGMNRSREGVHDFGSSAVGLIAILEEREAG